MSSQARPEVDARLLNEFMNTIHSLGGDNTGAMNRLALSPADAQARACLINWLRAQGLRVRVDRIGNIFGLLAWAGNDAPVVMTGSHLDSQPRGGRFDGAFGVVSSCAALAALKRFAEETGHKPKANFIIADWTNEEGARFQPSVLGSSVYAGELELAFALNRCDGEGISVAQALRQSGYDGRDDPPPPPGAYIEIHIEGAKNLETQGVKIGIFTGFWGALKYRLAFIGKQAHTGPTPMEEREDALLAASCLISELKSMADASGKEMHTSVGRLEVYPNSPNVVAGETVLFIELRSSAQKILDAAEAHMKEKIAGIARKCKVAYEVRAIDRRRAGKWDAGLIKLAEQAAGRRGEKFLHLASMAGHDAVPLNKICPAVVIAIPSAGGILHHPDEYSRPEDMLLGTQILCDMLWDICRKGVIPRA